MDARFPLVTTTPPSGQLMVSLAEVKQQCRIPADVVTEDDLLKLYIRAATNLLESGSERSLLNQVKKLYLQCFPSDSIRIETGPVRSLTVSYYNQSGVLTEVDASTYHAYLASVPGLVVPAENECWPTDLQLNRPAVVEVAMVCGYENLADIPRLEEAKLGILMLVGHWYRNREAAGSVTRETALSWKAVVNALKWRGYP